MLIKNLDQKNGLCNGTRMQITKLTQDLIYAKIITGPRRDLKKIYAIPMVKFENGSKKFHRGIKFRRFQFPVRPCFAMTVNKVSRFFSSIYFFSRKVKL